MVEGFFCFFVPQVIWWPKSFRDFTSIDCARLPPSRIGVVDTVGAKPPGADVVFLTPQ